jgi:uncharacterized membrane protein
MAAYMGMGLVVFIVDGPGPGGQAPGAGAIAGIVAAGAFLMLLMVAAFAYVWGGYHNLLLRVAQGKRAELTDLFSGNLYFWRLFWGNLLFGALAAVGLILFFIPYFFVLLMFWPFSYVIIDQNTGVVDAFRKSRELTSGNLLAIFILSLAAIGINLLGEMACMVGILFSAPLASLTFAVAYCRMSRQATAGTRRN